MRKLELLQPLSVSTFLYLFDGFILGSGIIAWLILFALGVSIVSWTVKSRHLADIKNDLPKRLIYLGTAVLIFFTNSINLRIAAHRAQLLVVACEQYRAAHGEYPRQLENLVPEFVSEIPLAKYTLFENRFKYISTEGRHVLLYSLIPFEHKSYVFEFKQWHSF
jgi:hypothetical protein